VPTLGRCTAVELAGSYLLVLAGTGVAVGATLAPGSYDALAVALAFGLTLAALAVALGPLSGCHLNPAVTLGLTVARRFPVRSVPAYLLAQAGGAVLASLTVWAGWGARARSVAHLGGCHSPAPAWVWPVPPWSRRRSRSGWCWW